MKTHCHLKIAIKSTIWYEALYKVLLVILSANEGATWKPVCIFKNGSKLS